MRNDDDDDKMNDEKMNDDDMKRMTDELRYEREQFELREREHEREWIHAERERDLMAQKNDLLQREREFMSMQLTAAAAADKNDITDEKTEADERPAVILRDGFALNSPASDVLVEFSGAFKMEKVLCIDKLSISTICELMTHMHEKNHALMQCLKDTGKEFSLSYGILQYENKLSSLKKIHPMTKDIITILAIADVSPELKSKVKACIRVAVKFDLRSLVKATDEMKDGILPKVSSDTNNDLFGQQRGMKQLQNSDFDTQVLHVKAIYDLVCKYVSFIQDKDMKFMIARSALDQFDVHSYSDCAVMLEDYKEAMMKCQSWSNDLFETTFDSMQRIVRKCNVKVTAAYIEAIADGDIAELDMSFDEFTSELTGVWNKVARKTRMEAGLKIRSGIMKEVTKLIFQPICIR